MGRVGSEIRNRVGRANKESKRIGSEAGSSEQQASSKQSSSKQAATTNRVGRMGEAGRARKASGKRFRLTFSNHLPYLLVENNQHATLREQEP